jgi:hypothetical protein
MSYSELIKSELVAARDVTYQEPRSCHKLQDVTTVTKLVCVGILLLAACGSSQPPLGTGDPGNKRLQMLASDPVFNALPAGAVLAKPIEQKPAEYRAPAFQATGWDGPVVIETFNSTETKDSIYAFFKVTAELADWEPNSFHISGYPQSWTKMYPGDVPATLILSDISHTDLIAGKPRMYQLSASAPAIG